jgi:septum formation protein
MFILASNSPRRKQLLALAGRKFVVVAAEVDEGIKPDEEPLAYVLRLAETKARTVLSEAGPEDVILAADTTVVDGENILGKPVDEAEAESMLRRLRGRTHQVYTAIAALRVNDELLLTDWCCTDVPMRRYSDDEMKAYISTGDPLDKAGAYAIQHAGLNPAENLNGCFANVMGLPLCHLTRTLEKLGKALDVDIAQACQSSIQYQCPIYTQVLDGSV